MAASRSHRGPEFAESYDHFAVDYEFPKGVHVLSQARQINGTDGDVNEYIVGTKGKWQSPGFRFETADGKTRIKGGGINPYVQEHIDLLQSIETGKPINELKQVAESTLTAIIGRMSAFTGKRVTWEQGLESKLDTFPKELKFGISLPGRSLQCPVRPS